MNSENFQTFFDCGFSKVRASSFNIHNSNEALYIESKFFTDQSSLELKIQKIITSLEKDTNEYINNIHLMIDSPKMLSVGISLFKKIDGSKLKQTNIQFLVQEAKQQILKHYTNYNITHIIINNYRIDDVDYSYLPKEIKCDFVSLDIFFICLPTDLISYFKNIFSKTNVQVDKIICSSYAKSINYKDNLNLSGYVSFVDIGFNKTSVISYHNNKILSLDVLPIGGNHITKDISKILKLDLKRSEQEKCNLDQNLKLINHIDISSDTLQEIIFARTDEIFKLCAKTIDLSLHTLGDAKIYVSGEGSKIFDNYLKDEIFFAKEINLLRETLEDICQSGFRLVTALNKQEVVVVPKKQIKQGFFEKFFHFFN
tara:strand:+ start:686 stop:1795 length:1110 start_codon:yes stop_codon:yes gene_type:complete